MTAARTLPKIRFGDGAPSLRERKRGPATGESSVCCSVVLVAVRFKLASGNVPSVPKLPSELVGHSELLVALQRGLRSGHDHEACGRPRGHYGGHISV